MNVTSGEPLAATLGTNVATNTFLNRKARTGNPGNLERCASAACRKLRCTKCATGAGTSWIRISGLKIFTVAEWTRIVKGSEPEVGLRVRDSHTCATKD